MIPKTFTDQYGARYQVLGYARNGGNNFGAYVRNGAGKLYIVFFRSKHASQCVKPSHSMAAHMAEYGYVAISRCKFNKERVKHGLERI